MVQAVWFDAGSQQAGRLLLMIHHLSVDGVSWRILMADLAAAWEAIAGGEEPSFAERGTSFRGWAHRLAAHAQDVSRVAELGFWTGMLSAPSLRRVNKLSGRRSRLAKSPPRRPPNVTRPVGKSSKPSPPDSRKRPS